MGSVRSHAFSIILLAAIFALMGYFVFTWQYATATPPMILLLKWTLRIGAIVFMAAGVLTLTGASAGLFLYGMAALPAAAVCLAVMGWELTSTYHSGPGPIILLVLGAWTGYTGFAAGRDFIVLARPPMQTSADAR